MYVRAHAGTTKHTSMELNHVRTLSHALTNARALQCYAYALMRKTGPEGRVGTAREVVGRGGEWARVERGGGEREDETCARHLATRMMAAAASGSEVPRSFT